MVHHNYNDGVILFDGHLHHTLQRFKHNYALFNLDSSQIGTSNFISDIKLFDLKINNGIVFVTNNISNILTERMVWHQENNLLDSNNSDHQIEYLKKMKMDSLEWSISFNDFIKYIENYILPIINNGQFRNNDEILYQLELEVNQMIEVKLVNNQI